MSYSDIAALANDKEFSARLVACVCVEAIGRPDDPLADRALTNTGYIPSTFMPMVSASPGFGDAYATGGQEAITDGMMLSAVQADWDRIADINGLVPVPPSTPTDEPAEELAP